MIDQTLWFLSGGVTGDEQLMLKALGAARDKLADYYSKTDEVDGDLFAIGTMLAPENKLQFFSGKDWDDDYDWRQRYRQSFEAYVKPYKQRLAHSQTSSQVPAPSLQDQQLKCL